MVSRSMVLATAIVASLLSATVGASSLYLWLDANGRQNYTDTCPPGVSCQLVGVETPLRSRSYAPSGSTSNGSCVLGPDCNTASTTTTTTTTTTTPKALLAQEVAKDSDLRNHPEILWYPRFDNVAEARKDWSTNPNVVYAECGTTGPGPKVCVVNAPEFGIPAFRWESMSLNPPTRYPGSSDGSTVMNFRKYLNQNTKEMYTGTALGNVPLNDLYLRYCIMLEEDVWTGMTELGVKLSGFDGRADGQGVKVGGPFWHSRPDAQGRIRLTTYWYGEGITDSTGFGGDWIQGKYLVPNKWHCLEQHLKVNSRNPDGTPNADGILEAWFDDELVYSKKNFVLHRYTGPLPIEINQVHGQIFHGGSLTPKFPIHWRVTGFALAKRRIGMPRQVH
jgi:hypothetical protein